MRVDFGPKLIELTYLSKWCETASVRYLLPVWLGSNLICFIGWNAIFLISHTSILTLDYDTPCVLHNNSASSFNISFIDRAMPYAFRPFAFYPIVGRYFVQLIAIRRISELQPHKGGRKERRYTKAMRPLTVITFVWSSAHVPNVQLVATLSVALKDVAKTVFHL